MKPKDLLKDLDSYRTGRFRIPKSLNKDQLLFLRKAREGDYPVTFPKMAELWEKVGWGKVTHYNMIDMYNKFIKK